MSENPRFDRPVGALHHLLWLGLGLALLAGCQTQPGTPPAALPTSRVLPDESPPADAVRYAIVPELTDVRFLVFRAGPLARLGHNHVIEARNVRGEILLAPDIHRSRFFMQIPVRDFQVDGAASRLAEGAEFLVQPDEEAIAGTTRNMLGDKVLDAANYPAIEIRSVALNGPDWGLDASVRIGMHGVEREIVVPLAVEHGRDELVVTAIFSVKPSDFGILPLRVLGGALQVDDTVKVRMRVVARKAGAESR